MADTISNRSGVDRDFWNERYRSRERVWSDEPNATLIAEVAELATGTALEVGCGEGADALWLARRGWHVTAVDIATVALERAERHVARLDPVAATRIAWTAVDILTWEPPATYALVTMHFMQLPASARDVVVRTLARAVAPGGTLLIVAHHPSDLHAGVRRPPMPEVYYTAADIAARLPVENWEIVVDEARERYATDAAGRSVAVRDTVLRAVRRYFTR
ncbi:MAG: class I SAM-dependent methyltransferase [Vulcanimicrobiaceae bacterium]